MSASFDGEGSQEPKEDPAGHLNSDNTEDDDDDDYEDHDEKGYYDHMLELE